MIARALVDKDDKLQLNAISFRMGRVRRSVCTARKRSSFVFQRHMLMPGEKVAYESPWSASQTDRADKLSGSGEQIRDTRQGSTGDQLSPELTSARQSCPSHLSHTQSPKILGDIHGDVSKYPLIL